MEKRFTCPKHIIVSILLLFSLSFSAQNNIWTKTSENIASRGELIARQSQPEKASYYSLNIENLKNALENTPRRSALGWANAITLDFPNAKGDMETFKILEASIMESELQAKYPELRSYVGQNVKDASSSIRFSITPLGLHAMVLSPNTASQIIDPYANNDTYICLLYTSDAADE